MMSASSRRRSRVSSSTAPSMVRCSKPTSAAIGLQLGALLIRDRADQAIDAGLQGVGAADRPQHVGDALVGVHHADRGDGQLVLGLGRAGRRRAVRAAQRRHGHGARAGGLQLGRVEVGVGQGGLAAVGQPLGHRQMLGDLAHVRHLPRANRDRMGLGGGTVGPDDLGVVPAIVQAVVVQPAREQVVDIEVVEDPQARGRVQDREDACVEGVVVADVDDDGVEGLRGATSRSCASDGREALSGCSASAGLSVVLAAQNLDLVTARGQGAVTSALTRPIDERRTKGVTQQIFIAMT
jgi:hypothetical protein